ncbi:unnamed protein product [Darwinula stevensoni]|uniref:Sulfotransferase domain-containing protein n=1 Tax=Darwinula stevensoni TaxID=69355 RepID=A0A7R9A992_9CRUS|nr:unnamed protein product [Darwinula stevensoni]CAG0896993.1 unnamed protein product [Darwinula stevensoni]
MVTKFIRSIPDGYVMLAYYSEFQKKNTFKPREDDIWIVTFLRSGTTWTQELTWCIVNIDEIEDARKFPLWFRTPFYEWDCLVPPDGLPDLSQLAIPFDTIEEADKHFQKHGNMVPHLESLPSPRVIKTHLPISLLPPEVRKNKIIYVSRNPKDSGISYYSLFHTFDSFMGTLDDFIEQSIHGISLWGPHWKHVREHWEMRNEPNVCFLTFESLCYDFHIGKLKAPRSGFAFTATNPHRQNAIEEIERLARFLGKDLTQEQTKAVEEEASIERMREKSPVTESNYRWKHLNPSRDTAESFIRGGRVGGWRNVLDEDQVEKIDKYIRE